MSKYLFIESRDPFETSDVKQVYELVSDLSKQGNTVTLYLVQNGVFAARSGAKSGPFSHLLTHPKIKLLADDFSLTERGIDQNSLAKGVSLSNVDQLVDLLLEEGQKAVWH